MVYMENKGYSDIVGNPNAPYINSLIDTYGFASNYYALTHPSSANYYPILGGSDFGTYWNCFANCFDEPNLADSIEAAGKTWAGYKESSGGYSLPHTPFLSFSDIYNDSARVESHLFNLTQMATDLANEATTPNFVWFSPDDATSMEGPLDFPFGLVQWLASQLTTHQYNIGVGDAWLAGTVPTILDSAVWNDPSKKCAIFVTFDEDFDSSSLGFGNEGNHIPMIVIPSEGAVTAGMRPGHFIAGDNYTHYSLLRTIEEALGLPGAGQGPLTNNDEYAQPMNEFWN